MKRIYSAPDPLTIHALEAFLKNRGLDVLVKGEDRLTAAGGIPMTECWPELMIVDDKKEQEAKDAVVEFFASTDTAKDSWKCPKCGEDIEGQFTDCWKCPSISTPKKSLVLDAKILSKVRLFRFLVLLNAISYLSSSWLDERAYKDLPKSVLEFIRSSYPDTYLFSTDAENIYFWLGVFSWVGLFFFFNVARHLYIFLWIWGLITWGFLKVTISSGPAVAVGSLSNLIGGAIIVLAYTRPLKSIFRKEHNKRVDATR